MKKLKDGRYRGDLAAQLHMTPGERKPYQVVVWSWNYDRFDIDGMSWAVPNDLFDHFGHKRSFRSLARAVRYCHAVKADADLGWLRTVLRKRSESQRERIL